MLAISRRARQFLGTKTSIMMIRYGKSVVLAVLFVALVVLVAFVVLAALAALIALTALIVFGALVVLVALVAVAVAAVVVVVVAAIAAAVNRSNFFNENHGLLRRRESPLHELEQGLSPLD